MAKKNKSREKLSATYSEPSSRENSTPNYSNCKEDCGSCGSKRKSGMNSMNNMDSKNCR